MNEMAKTCENWLPEGFHCLETRDALTGKKLRTYRHDCGLLVKVLPRPGFSRRFAAVTVPYGSIHTNFGDGSQSWQVPAGTAHFLEHCIFSRDDGGGLLGKLSELGASANAYTTHSHTMYHFSTVHHFAEALEIYLDAIFRPYLEQDRVEAERPVILAELDQYRDDPDTRCYMNLVENLFAAHPVRLDIGGTAESVRRITSGDLKAVWSHFYQPFALSLTLAGELDEAAILQNLASRLDTYVWPAASPGSKAAAIRAILPEEPDRPVSPLGELAMDVAVPSFLVGIKDPGPGPGRELTGRALVTRQRAARLLFDTLLSPVSPLFDSLYADGLINDSFGFHYACEESFAFLACGGESSQPEAAASALRERLVGQFRAGVDSSLFEIQKRAAAGDFVRSLDSVEHSGMVQAQCNLHGLDLFDYPALYDKMDSATASRMMSFLADPSCYTISILHPSEVTASYET